MTSRRSILASLTAATVALLAAPASLFARRPTAHPRKIVGASPVTTWGATPPTPIADIQSSLSRTGWANYSLYPAEEWQLAPGVRMFIDDTDVSMTASSLQIFNSPLVNPRVWIVDEEKTAESGWLCRNPLSGRLTFRDEQGTEISLNMALRHRPQIRPKFASNRQVAHEAIADLADNNGRAWTPAGRAYREAVRQMDASASAIKNYLSGIS